MELLVNLLLEKIPGQEHVNAEGHGLLHFAAESDPVDGDEAIVRTVLEREGLPQDRKVADAQSGGYTVPRGGSILRYWISYLV